VPHATSRILAHSPLSCQYQSSRTFSGKRPESPKAGLYQLERDIGEAGCKAELRVPAGAELGNEPVAIAAVDRDGELDDLAVRRAGDPLEEERGGVERHAEHLGLLLVRDGRLDRLRPARDLDPVAAVEQLVERALLEVDRAQA